VRSYKSLGILSLSPSSVQECSSCPNAKGCAQNRAIGMKAPLDKKLSHIIIFLKTKTRLNIEVQIIYLAKQYWWMGFQKTCFYIQNLTLMFRQNFSKINVHGVVKIRPCYCNGWIMFFDYSHSVFFYLCLDVAKFIFFFSNCLLY